MNVLIDPNILLSAALRDPLPERRERAHATAVWSAAYILLGLRYSPVYTTRLSLQYLQLMGYLLPLGFLPCQECTVCRLNNYFRVENGRCARALRGVGGLSGSD